MNEEESKLALWCMQQARAYKEGRLSEEQFKLLEEINFPFEYYLGAAEDLERFKPYTCRIQMTEGEFKTGPIYKQIQKKGYGIVDDIIFMQDKDLYEFCRRERMDKDDVRSLLESNVIIAIEVG